MSYKTILVQANESGNRAERFRIAIELALQFGAHLTGAAVTGGIRRYAFPGAWAADPGGYSAFLAAQVDVLRERAEAALAAFEDAVKNQGLRSFERALVDDEAAPGLNLRARYCDLVILGQNTPGESTPVTPDDLPEQLVLGSGRPVLIVPHAGAFPQLPGRAMVAWDGSLSAARAVTGALPLLAKGGEVDVAVFSGDASDVEGDNPGDDVALYLARHDLKVNLLRSDSKIGSGEALLALATDRGANLLVMGGYGHNRVRELVLGGVTRTVLHRMTVPTLMVH